MMRQLLQKLYSPLLAVLWNLLLVYVVYQIARLAYYLENSTLLTYSYDMWCGGLLFDTSAILYTNVLYVVLMLFPLHWKERPAYHRFCKGLFLLVNGIALAINLADAVYFQYTMRRTTTTVFSEFSNEGNLAGIVSYCITGILCYCLWLSWLSSGDAMPNPVSTSILLPLTPHLSLLAPHPLPPINGGTIV